MIIYCLIASAVAWCTFYLVKRPKITPTRASSLLSLFIIAFLFALNKFLDIDLTLLSALVFGASFVGMCSHKIISDLEVVFGGIIFGLLFLYLVPRLEGVGGALGFSAFLSISISRVCSSFLNKKA